MDLTLIMATLNAAQHVADALRGLPPGVQVIVVDGGSTDGTQAKVAGNPAVQLINAPGSSIYEAWNLGLEAVNRGWVGFLNADDGIELDPDAIGRLPTQGGANEPPILRGGAEYYRGGLRPEHRLERCQCAPLTPMGVLLGVPAINTCLVSRELFDSVGNFDTRFALAADRDWLFRCALAGHPVQPLEGYIYRYRLHPGSKTLNPAMQNAYLIGVEHMTLARSHLCGAPPEARSALQKCFREAAVTACAAALNQKRPDRFLRVVAEATREQPDWPVRAIPVVARKLSNRMRRKSAHA